MAATVLPHIKALPPRPDVTHPTSALYGVAKRMAYAPKKANPKMLKKFRKFVRRWVRDNLTPLENTEEFDFEEWLESTNYTNARKDELRRVHAKIIAEDLADPVTGLNINATIKYFVKEEWYPEYKHFRGIWSRSDAFKVICGPFFKKIEKALFSHPYFIKKIPKDQRADYIMNFMFQPGFKYKTTDFTSYESHFMTELMYNCEFELYQFMSSNNERAMRLLQIIFDVIANCNYATNKYFNIAVDAKRMSGEMNTSLGNGFSNLMFLLFAVDYYKLPFTGPVVEGDDGLLGLIDDIPEEYFELMGLNVKMDTTEMSHASFCGMVFDTIERINVTDPRKPLCTMMWVPRKYAGSGATKIKGLIKCKAMSMIYEYPGCPIISVLAHKVFNLLDGVSMVPLADTNYDRRRIDLMWTHHLTNPLPVKPIGTRTRQLVEDLYGISVTRQLMIENDINNMTLENWNTNNVQIIMPELWVSNYQMYCVKQPIDNSKLNNFNINTKNKFLPLLHELRDIGSVRYNIGKLMDFSVFSNHPKYFDVPIHETMVLYKKYKDDWYKMNTILHEVAKPICFRPPIN